MVRVLIFVAAILVWGCVNEKQLVQRFAPKEDDEFARKFVELIRRSQYEEADHMIDPGLIAKNGAVPLTQLHQVLNHGEPISFEMIGANVGFFRPWDGSESKRRSNLTYQIQFPDAWVVAAFVIESSSGGKYIAGANLQPVSDSLQALNRFTFKNKSALHYLFLVACVFVPLFILSTIVICIFSRIRLRWLWIIFILFGVMQFQLNWTTRQTSVQSVSVLLLGGAFFRASSYAPVFLSFGIPIGAIVFLAFLPWLRRKGVPRPSPLTPI